MLFISCLLLQDPKSEIVFSIRFVPHQSLCQLSMHHVLCDAYIVHDAYRNIMFLLPWQLYNLIFPLAVFEVLDRIQVHHQRNESWWISLIQLGFWELHFEDSKLRGWEVSRLCTPGLALVRTTHGRGGERTTTLLKRVDLSMILVP